MCQLNVGRGHRRYSTLTVDVVDLSWKEEKEHKVVATTQERDEKNDNHSSLGFAEESSRYHGIWSVDFPDEECNDEDDTQDQWSEVMSAPPRVLQKVSIYQV